MHWTISSETSARPAWEPAASAAALMDHRVARVRATMAPPVRPWPRRHLRLVLLMAAALGLMGASLTLSLLQQAAGLMPGWRVAYAQAKVLDLSQTANGYTVALERGYLDPNQLVLGFVVTGPDGQFRAVPRRHGDRRPGPRLVPWTPPAGP